jgi:hypothetical protein
MDDLSWAPEGPDAELLAWDGTFGKGNAYGLLLPDCPGVVQRSQYIKAYRGREPI